ncbi:MAG: hypothetical protein DRR00_10385 [Candidatus Parabeggiatoa sp. nov. 3]|nr:MAG: hypothetical protein DRR00_10385 [Gammaproteobacteria bacterium]RKZ65148.1 MAG: hypothetical protein DRQ99_13540 [Gammaproteobacteria bacterium]
MKNNQEELAFLPAALEIQEKPPSPIGRAIIWAIISFFILALIWASVGQVDVVATAQGKIIPSGRVKVIQPLETGVVKRIWVEEGQLVKAGQLLIELDSTVSGADLARLKTEGMMAKLEQARLEALLAAIRQGKLQSFVKPADAESLQVELQQARLKKQFREYQARLAALANEIQQREAERATVMAHIGKYRAIIPLITERVQTFKKMVNKQLHPRVQWLELEQERIELVKEQDIQYRQMAVIEAAIAGLKQQQDLLQVQAEAQYLAELVEIRHKWINIKQELIKAEQRKILQSLKAPTAGQIQQLAIHTVGGVVTPAQPLMMIVPEAQHLEVEAWVQNKDIGFIEEGEQAEVKVESFPFTKYGTLDAEVVTLSHDAVAKENIGLVYAARVSLKQTRIKVNKNWVNLTAGMAVVVEIKTGKRRLIEYFLRANTQVRPYIASVGANLRVRPPQNPTVNESENKSFLIYNPFLYTILVVLGF